jgi:hypothetical protein
MNKNNLPVQLTIALSSNSLVDCDIEQKLIISINDLKFHELLGTGEFACKKCHLGHFCIIGVGGGGVLLEVLI